jgi:hypothetical protein
MGKMMLVGMKTMPALATVLQPVGHLMLEQNTITTAAATPLRAERRKNIRQRDIIAYGMIAGQDNVIAGVEYLRARGVEAHIVERVVQRMLARRLALREMMALSDPP